MVYLEKNLGKLSLEGLRELGFLNVVREVQVIDAAVDGKASSKDVEQIRKNLQAIRTAIAERIAKTS